MSSIRMERVAKSFGNKVVLSGLSLAVQPGTIYALVGRRGSGKTTALKVIAGKVRADAGRVTTDGLACLPDPKLGDLLRTEAPYRRSVILLDEPCLGMSAAERWAYLQEVRTLARLTGAAVIIASRDLGELAEVADAGGLLEDGRIVQPLSKMELRACEARSLWGAPDAVAA